MECLLVAIGIGLLLLLVQQWPLWPQTPPELGPWRCIPGYERYQLDPSTGHVQSWVVPGRPRAISRSPYQLRRYAQRGEPSVTLYARNGTSRSYTISEIYQLLAGSIVSGDDYNPARKTQLLPQEVQEIRLRLERGEAVDGIAAKYSVSASTIRDIANRKTCKDLD